MTAARLGFYPQQWTKIIKVMIYKERGNFNLDNLRVIHLFEVDAMYNAGDTEQLGFTMAKAAGWAVNAWMLPSPTFYRSQWPT
jgi:hypothetical protein